jgi:hypothetical protein
MSTLEEIKVVEPEPEKKKIKIGPDPDLYNRVKLPQTPDQPFHLYVDNIDNFKNNVDFATRLRRGLMHNGTDNRDRGTVVISFRGSVTFDDFNTDRVFMFRNMPGAHSLNALIPDIQRELAQTDRYVRNKQFIIEQMNTYFNGKAINGSNSYWDFYVTGHSLGGGLSESLSMDGLVHGGYSFSAPVDDVANKHAYSMRDFQRKPTNAPTYRTINYMDKVIGGLTDATTGGDAIYDNVIQGTVLSKQAGHELSQFKGQKVTTEYEVPPYAPGTLQRVLGPMVGPVETTRRGLENIQENIEKVIPKAVTTTVTKPLTSAFNNFTNLVRPLPSLPMFRGRGRCWKGCKPTPGKKPYSKGSCTCTKKRKRGTGPPPTYPLSLALAKDAYSEKFDAPQSFNEGSGKAILCPAPISCQEVKFYVCNWPSFSNDEERDDNIGDLVKILTDTPMGYVASYDKREKAEAFEYFE